MLVNYVYRARSINEDDLFGDAYGSVVGGATALDTADGDTSYVEVVKTVGPTTNAKGTFRWEPVGAAAPPLAQWTKAVIAFGSKVLSGDVSTEPTINYHDALTTNGINYGEAYFPGLPDIDSADGYTIKHALLLAEEAAWGDPDATWPDPLGSDTYFILSMGGTGANAASSRVNFAQMTVSVEAPDPVMQRTHIHLPITKADGDLLLFAEVSLLDPSSNAVRNDLKVFDGPHPGDTELAWPVTFAPANVDLWLEVPGRFDLRVLGPDGYGATIAGVDFLPAPAHQVPHPLGLKVTNTPRSAQWLAGDTDKTARFKDTGLVSAHDHSSTVLSTRVVSDADSTAAGSASVAAAGGTALGNDADAATDSVVIGTGSDAGSGGVSVGDQHVSMPASRVSLTQDSGGDENAYQSGTALHLRNGLSTTSSEDQVGFATLPSTPAGVTHPVWIAGDAQTQSLTVPGDAVVGEDVGTVGFYDSEGDVKGPHLTGATGVLADLILALEGYGLLADS